MRRRHRAALVGVVSLIVSLVAPASAGATSANMGPVLGPLPAVAYDGGPGTAALNAAVSQACTAGAPLGNPRWFTLPDEDVGTLLVNGQQIDDRFLGKGADDVYPTSTALVDVETGQVLGCGQPVRVDRPRPLAAVAWIAVSDAEAYWTYVGGYPHSTVGVIRSSTTVPVNDSLSAPVAISSVPFEYSGDSGAATWDGPALPDPYGCDSEITGTYGNTVWFRWTATWTGEVQSRVVGDGFNAVVVMTDATGTSALQMPRDEMCPIAGYQVVAGTTYLIGVAGYGDTYYSQPPLFFGGRYHLYVGPPQAPASPLEVGASPGSASVAVTWTGDGRAAGQAATSSFRVRLDDLVTGTSREQVVDAAARSVSFTGLVADRRYRAVVSAVNAAGAGMPSWVDATTGSSAGSAPEQVDASVDSAAGTATLSWSPPCCMQSVTGYAVTLRGTGFPAPVLQTRTVPATAAPSCSAV